MQFSEFQKLQASDGFQLPKLNLELQINNIMRQSQQSFGGKTAASLKSKKKKKARAKAKSETKWEEDAKVPLPDTDTNWIMPTTPQTPTDYQADELKVR